MYTGMYLNAAICFIIFISALYISYFIYKKNKGNLVDFSFAAYWLVMGITWLVVAFDLIVFQFGNIANNIFINQFFIQPLIYLQMAVGSYFIFYRLTRKNNLSWIGTTVIFMLSFIGIYFAYQPNSIKFNSNTFISVEYSTSNNVLLIFQIILSIVVLAILYDFLRNLYYWLKKIELFEQKYFFAYIALMIYGGIGYYDQVGSFPNWLGFLFRLTLILCIMITYLAYSDNEI